MDPRDPRRRQAKPQITIALGAHQRKASENGGKSKRLWARA